MADVLDQIAKQKETPRAAAKDPRSEEYSGWKNRATWNVALWVGNDEGLYNSAVEYARGRRDRGKRPTWGGFVAYAGLAGEKTPDGYKFDGSRLDYKALSEMLAEFVP